MATGGRRAGRGASVRLMLIIFTLNLDNSGDMLVVLMWTLLMSPS
jgi:hypothetical protein